MVKIIKILILVLLTSMFFFPFEFMAIRGINTKMMLAVAGIPLVVYEMIKLRRSLNVPLELMWLFLFAGGVSLASLLSITVNQTPDTTFVGYIVSFAVWLSGAYAICCLIRGVHGRIDVRLILDYLVGVCVFQCIAALAIDSYPVVQRWVDTHISQGQQVLREIERLYGIGASLDVAGARFSAVLVGLGFYLTEIKKSLAPGRRIAYIVSFLFISVAGNMIARTTTVGAAIGGGIILLSLFFSSEEPGTGSKGAAVASWLLLLMAGLIVSITLYNTSPKAKELFRFAFEGFFSYVEEGDWSTDSTEKLETMIVWPETVHTWVIGDGYFLNSRYDENYLGDATDQGFYMGTDIGYLRFIFYFGIIGLIPMMGVIIYSAIVCIKHFRKEGLLFFLALLVGLSVWLKVSTDILPFFALFLGAASMQYGGDDSPETIPDHA